MQDDGSLLTMQRCIMQAMYEPLQGESRSRTSLGPRVGDTQNSFLTTASLLIKPSGTLNPTQRLELYHRQVWYRMLDALEEDFPALKQLLGDRVFWLLLEGYLETHPSRSFTLRHLGYRLPAYIATYASDEGKDLPDAVDVETMAKAAELARLEVAICQAFEAGESTPIPGSSLGERKITLQAHVKPLALHWGADTFWRRHQRDPSCAGQRVSGSGSFPLERRRSRSHHVVVYRQGYGLHVKRLSRAAFAILDALQTPVSLDLAMDRLAQVPGLFRTADMQRVSTWFSEWITRGWLCDGEQAAGIAKAASHSTSTATKR